MYDWQPRHKRIEEVTEIEAKQIERKKNIENTTKLCEIFEKNNHETTKPKAAVSL